MMRFRWFALLLGLCLAPSAAQAEFRHVEDATLHDVQFVDDEEGWAVGDEGAIWHTINGGKEWYQQKSGTRASLRSVCFLSGQVGWVAGREELPDGRSAGVLLFTKNGGARWHRVFLNTFPGLNKIQFLDVRTGFLLGDGTERLPAGLFKTTDRGRTWRPVEGSRSPSWLDGDFSDKNTGALTGPWNRISILRRGSLNAANVDELGGRNVRGIRLLSGGRAVAVGDGGLVLVSRTAGAGWAYAELNLSPKVLANLDFHGLTTFEEHVWVVGRPGSVILHSGDQGRNWQVMKTGQPLSLYGVYFKDAKKGWAVGALGTILATTDGGRTWAVQRRGGQRSALLFAHAHAKDMPSESLAQLGLEEGFLITGVRVLAPDPKSAALQQAVRENSFRSGVRLSGGAAADVLWQFPLPEHLANSSPQQLMNWWNTLHNQRAADQMLRQLVLSLRMWRPDVVITDPPDGKKPGSGACALVSEALKRACELAADEKAFPEQLENLGLQPWRVSRLYALARRRTGADVSIDGNELCGRLRGTPCDYAAPAAALLQDGDATLPAQRFFRLLQSHVPGGAGQRYLMSGLELKAGKGARRALLPQSQPDDQLVKAMKMRRNLQTLTNNPIKGLNEPRKMAAEISKVLDKLPAGQGAPAAFAIAGNYVRTGQWALAQETYLALVDHYPTHPLTAHAYRWLVQHNTSSEVHRRYELKHFIFADHSTLVPPKVPSAGQVQQMIEQRRKQVRSQGGQKAGSPRQPKQFPLLKPGDRLPFKASKADGTGQLTYLRNELDMRGWYEHSLDFARRLGHFGKLYSRDPAILFCVQSARRNLGQFQKVQQWYKSYTNNATGKSPWRVAAAAEQWLSYRDGPAPKPVLFCRLTPTRPFLDGKFDDPCWRDVKPAVLTNAAGDTLKQHRTEVRMSYDQDFLYLALTCTHPAKYHVPPVKKRPRDADLRSFDRVSLMLDLDRDYSTYFHFQVDQRGCVFEDCWGDKKWNPRWFVAVRNSKTAWHIEAAIPLSQLTGQHVALNTAWACNVVRILPGRGVQAVSLPAGVAPRPEGMGLMLFQDAAPPRRIAPVSGQFPAGR